MSKRELKVSRRSLDDNGYELPAARENLSGGVVLFIAVCKGV